MSDNTTNNRYAANPYSDFISELPPPPKKSKKKLLIIGVVSTVLILIIGVIAALSVKNEPKLSINVPDGWKNVETEAGISVIMPNDWQTQPTETQSQGSLTSSMAGIGPPVKGFRVGKTTLTDTDVPTYTFISVGISKQPDKSDQVSFEQMLSDKNVILQEYYEEQGINKEELILTSEKKFIDDMEWLEVYSEHSGQYSKSLYRWTGKQAITIKILSDNKDNLETNYNDYVLPVAASAILL